MHVHSSHVCVVQTLYTRIICIFIYFFIRYMCTYPRYMTCMMLYVCVHTRVCMKCIYAYISCHVCSTHHPFWPVHPSSHSSFPPPPPPPPPSPLLPPSPIFSFSHIQPQTASQSHNTREKLTSAATQGLTRKTTQRSHVPANQLASLSSSR